MENKNKDIWFYEEECPVVLSGFMKTATKIGRSYDTICSMISC